MTAKHTYTNRFFTADQSILPHIKLIFLSMSGIFLVHFHPVLFQRQNYLEITIILLTLSIHIKTPLFTTVSHVLYVSIDP